MIPATEVLRKEHQIILKMLDAADEVADQLNQCEHVAPETLFGIIELFQVFADRCHHAKEEEFLFPLLIGKGLPRAAETIADMKGEHVIGRSLIRQMLEAAADYQAGLGHAGFTWGQLARDYIGMERAHIAKENNLLLVTAEGMLSEAEQYHLAADFERSDRETMSSGTQERLQQKLEQLVAGIEQVSATAL